MKTSITRNKKIVASSIWIIIWQLVSMIINQPLFLPSPFQTVAALFNIAKATEFYLSLGSTLLRVLLSLFISSVIGISLGILSARYNLLKIFLEPLVSTIKSVPVISFIILILVYAHSTMVPIIVSVLLCIPIMYTNTQKGMLTIDNDLIEMAELHKVSKKKILTHIKIPAILHYILSALMICIGFTWKSVVTAEVLSAPLHSIGFNLYQAKIYIDMQSVFAWTLAIVILSIAIEKTAVNLIKNSKWKIGD